MNDLLNAVRRRFAYFEAHVAIQTRGGAVPSSGVVWERPTTRDVPGFAGEDVSPSAHGLDLAPAERSMR